MGDAKHPPAPPPPRRASRPIEAAGVAQTLDGVQRRMDDRLAAWMMERLGRGVRVETVADIALVAQKAGMLARELCSDGVGEAFQLGVNRAVPAAVHETPTGPVGDVCPHCGHDRERGAFCPHCGRARGGSAAT